MFKWNYEKNNKLLEERGFSFNDLIENGKILGMSKNNSENHKNQLVYHIEYNNYEKSFIIYSMYGFFMLFNTNFIYKKK